MNKKILFLIVGLVAVGIVVYSLSSSLVSTSPPSTASPSSGDYATQLISARREKDEYFRSSEESPLSPADKAAFGGLVYFEPDASWVVKARLTKFDTGREMMINMTKGEVEKYRPFGKALFERDGQVHSLLLLKASESDNIFLIFKDLSNQTDTYGGGRYLDIPASAVSGDSLTIDFNLSYNPFCAYNHEFTCPVPPDENKLKIAVRAGEKRWPIKDL